MPRADDAARLQLLGLIPVCLGVTPFRLSVAELRAHVAAYRRAAQNARLAKVRDGLFKLAGRFDALADQREQEQLRRKSGDGGASRSG